MGVGTMKENNDPERRESACDGMKIDNSRHSRHITQKVRFALEPADRSYRALREGWGPLP